MDDPIAGTRSAVFPSLRLRSIGSLGRGETENQPFIHCQLTEPEASWISTDICRREQFDDHQLTEDCVYSDNQ